MINGIVGAIKVTFILGRREGKLVCSMVLI